MFQPFKPSLKDSFGSTFTVHAVAFERSLSGPKPAVRAADPIGCSWPQVTDPRQ
jgi:hypothetical protein